MPEPRSTSSSRFVRHASHRACSCAAGAALTKTAVGSGLGEARFIEFTPPVFARAYSACDLARDLKAAGVAPVRAEGQALPACGK